MSFSRVLSVTFPSALIFVRIKGINKELPVFILVPRADKVSNNAACALSPEEAAVIIRMERLIRQQNFHGITDIEKAFSRHDPVLANPRVRSLVGQAYSALGSDFREEARGWFKAADGLGYRDVF